MRFAWEALTIRSKSKHTPKAHHHGAPGARIAFEGSDGASNSPISSIATLLQLHGVCLGMEALSVAPLFFGHSIYTFVWATLLLQLHGVCLGMEALSVAVSQNHSILSNYDSENLPSPIFLTGEGACCYDERDCCYE